MESLQEIVPHAIIIHLQSDLSPSAIEVMTMHLSLLGFAWQSWLKTLVNGKFIFFLLYIIGFKIVHFFHSGHKRLIQQSTKISCQENKNS